MQKDRGAAVLDKSSERLNQIARHGATLLKTVPYAFWRFLVGFFLVLWLSHSVARFVWLMIPSPEVPQAQVGANALISDNTSSVGRRVDVEAMKKLQVFGRVDEEAVANKEEPAFDTPGIEDEAVDTDLRLELQGVMDSNAEGGGRAVIASGSKQAIYAPGDELPEGHNVTLEKVLPQRVILNNNGRYESLWLYQESDFAAVSHHPGDEADKPDRRWEGEESQADVGPDEELDASGAEEVVDRVSRSVSDVVSMSIHRENGQIAGYQIRPGEDSATFDALGLESGDIVKAVNGTELTSPQRVMELYRNMGDASSVSLLIERDGQEVSIDIDLE